MKWRWLIISILLVLNLALWWVVVAKTPTEELTITFLDVGQGDAILIEAPNHNQMLIDGGPDRQVLSALGRHFSWYDHSLDVILATHPDQDHIAGLIDVLKRDKSEILIEPKVKEKKDLYEALKQTAVKRGVRELSAQEGMLINLGGGVGVKILSAVSSPGPDSSNESSIVAKITYGRTSALLTGDAPKTIEANLVKKYGSSLKVDLLKLGHHGSKSSSGDFFLKTTKPKYAIISAAKDNRYNLPNSEVLTLLKDLKIPSYRTDEVGDIGFESDGNSFRPLSL